MNTSFTVTLAAAMLAASASAFWGTGHVLIARHAQAVLEENSPETLQTALQVLSTLKASYPSITEDEDSHPFTECATFADNIKGQGYSFQSGWHFIDQPYLDQGGTVEDYPEFVMDSEDVIDALTDLTAFLKGEKVPEDSPYITQIAEHFPEVADQESFALRLVIHYVGDLHQPLHAVSEVDDYYPKGDRGGNSEWIDPNIGGVGNLHSVWDSVIYSAEGYPDLPLDCDDWDWYTNTAAEYSTEYPTSASEMHDGDFNEWAAESLQMAKDYVYKDFVNHEVPDSDYQDSRRPILEARMVYAGERLAALVQSIYGSETKSLMKAFAEQLFSTLD